MAGSFPLTFHPWIFLPAGYVRPGNGETSRKKEAMTGEKKTT